MALEVLYVGWDYHGFARQETTENTIEVCMPAPAPALAVAWTHLHLQDDNLRDVLGCLLDFA